VLTKFAPICICSNTNVEYRQDTEKKTCDPVWYLLDGFFSYMYTLTMDKKLMLFLKFYYQLGWSKEMELAFKSWMFPALYCRWILR
jgi:hypothetical protein